MLSLLEAIKTHHHHSSSEKLPPPDAVPSLSSLFEIDKIVSKT